MKRLRRFMEEVPDGESTVPKSCEDCECYQPNWKYRTCLYSKCKYNKPINPFRRKPLPNDVIPNYEWEMKQLHDEYVEMFGW